MPKTSRYYNIVGLKGNMEFRSKCHSLMMDPLGPYEYLQNGVFL
jgi:hypothetical protein